MGQDDRNEIVDAFTRAGEEIAADAADVVNFCGNTLEECFPAASYKSIEIDGVIYHLKIEVSLMK